MKLFIRNITLYSFIIVKGSERATAILTFIAAYFVEFLLKYFKFILTYSQNVQLKNHIRLLSIFQFARIGKQKFAYLKKHRCALLEKFRMNIKVHKQVQKLLMRSI